MSMPGGPALDAAPGGAAAVDRALSLLLAFRPGDAALALADLARRTGLHKSTALRLLASLMHAGLVVRDEAGAYALGPAVARLHAIRTAAQPLEAVAMPVLRELVARTGESASFHVRRGDQRVCLLRVDSPQVLRDHLRPGDLLPMDRGAGAWVLRAYEGAAGEAFERIRAAGVAQCHGDRVADLSGVSAPVFGADGALAGALTLTMPTARHRPEHAAQVREAAAGLSARLGAPVRHGPPDPGTIAAPRP